MAETYKGARLFRDALDKRINENIGYAEDIGYFDFGQILESGELITGVFGKGNPIPSSAYKVCQNLLGQESRPYEEDKTVTMEKRLEPGTGYLVCYVNSIPVVIDRTFTAQEVL